MSPNSVSSGMRLSIHPSKSTPTQASSLPIFEPSHVKGTHTDHEGISQRKLMLVVNPSTVLGPLPRNTSVDYRLSMWM